METPDTQIKKIILSRLGRCSVCHHEYVAEDIRVLSRKPQMWMMLVECAECRTRNFVAAVLDEGDASEAQRQLRQLGDRAMHVDEDELTAAIEAELEAHFAETGQTPISEDDVGAMREFLEGFNGDFATLFAGDTNAENA